MLTVTTLASGSSGNSTLVSCGRTHILLDAGISARRITTAMQEVGVDPAQLNAIFITHEHQDHIAGLQVLTKKLRVPVVATNPTCGQLADKCPGTLDLLRSQKPGTGVRVGSLWVESFATPHDAAGPVCYRVSSREGTMMVCTDLGYVTEEVRAAAGDCDLLLCEANHDVEWVKNGPYPYYLKERILGEQGHLCNEAGGELAAYSVAKGCRTVLLAHLSAENNTPAHAREAVCRVLRGAGIDPEHDLHLSVAPRKEHGPTFQVVRSAAPVQLEKGERVC